MIISSQLKFDKITGQLVDYRPEALKPLPGQLDYVISGMTVNCSDLQKARTQRARKIAADSRRSWTGSNSASNAILNQLASQVTNIAGATVSDFVNQQLSGTGFGASTLGALGAGFNMFVATLAATPEIILVISSLMIKNLRKWLELRIRAVDTLENITQRVVVLIRSILPILGEDLNYEQRKAFLEAIQHLNEALRFITIYGNSAEAVFKYGRGSIKQTYLYSAIAEIDNAIGHLTDGERSAISSDATGHYSFGDAQREEYTRYLREAKDLMNLLINLDVYKKVYGDLKNTDRWLDPENMVTLFGDLDALIAASPLSVVMIGNLVIEEYLRLIPELIHLMTVLKTLRNVTAGAAEFGLKNTIYGDGNNTAKSLVAGTRKELQRMSGRVGNQISNNIGNTLGTGTEKVWCITQLSLAKAEMLTINNSLSSSQNAGTVINELDGHIKQLKKIINYINNDYPKRGERTSEQIDAVVIDLGRSISTYVTNVSAGRKKVLLSLKKFRIIRRQILNEDLKLISVLNGFTPENSATLQVLTDGYNSMVQLLQQLNSANNSNIPRYNYAAEQTQKDFTIRLAAGCIDVVVLILAIITKGVDIFKGENILSTLGLSQDAINKIGKNPNTELDNMIGAGFTSNELAGYVLTSYWNQSRPPCDVPASVPISAGAAASQSISKDIKITNAWESNETSEYYDYDGIRANFPSSDGWIHMETV